jgi:hypothetical protein
VAEVQKRHKNSKNIKEKNVTHHIQAGNVTRTLVWVMSPAISEFKNVTFHV